VRLLSSRAPATIRLRLTLWYGGLFLLAGSVLLAINFALVSQNFPSERLDFRDQAAERLGIPIDAFMSEVRIEFAGRPSRPGAGAREPRAFAATDVFDEIGAQLKAETLEQLLWQSGLLLGVMGVTSMGVGWWIAGRMLRPLAEITGTVRRISDENLYERVRLEGPRDELRELAAQFDVMLERLEHAFRAQHDFVANASHELRTPLTVIRTEVDVSLAGGQATAEEQRHTADVVRRAIARAEALIEGLLILARADAPLGPTEPLSLAELAEQALAARADEAEAVGLRVERELGVAEVAGERVMLERLVDNLVQNAIIHNVRGGWLSLITSQDDEEARLVVSSSGAPFDDAEVERLFERFRRGDESRARPDVEGGAADAASGYGLGLPIVRAVAEHHGGYATARALSDGGIEVTATFRQRQRSAALEGRPRSRDERPGSSV
jgi:hypothetical protein